MKRFSLIVCFCVIATSVIAQEQASPRRRSPMPMLKDGSPSAYVLFERPKRAHGLAMMNPAGSGYAVEPLKGYLGVSPAPDSKDDCLYFKTASDQIALATGTFFVTVSYFDRGRGAIEIHYKSPGSDIEKTSRSDRIYLKNSNAWQEHTFTLSGAVLDNSMEGETSFRFYCPGVAIRGVSVARFPMKTANRGPVAGFQQTSVSPPAGYTFGIVPAANTEKSIWKDDALLDEKAKLYLAWGTPYIINTIEATRVKNHETRLDYSACAERAEKLSARDLTWVPRIKIGDLESLPASAIQLLQHAQGTERSGLGSVASLWDKRLEDVYETIFSDLRTSLQNVRVPMMILSIAGDWAPLCLSWEGNRASVWPDLWAGDPLAMTQFQTYLQSRYGRVQSAGASWGESFSHWNQVKPSISPGHSPRRIIETYTWYQNALTSLTARIGAKAAYYFPGVKIVIEVGDGFLYGATDFDALAELAGKRSWPLLFATNKPNPTTLTSWRLLARACRTHNVEFGIRSSLDTSQPNILSPLFSLASEGGRLFFFQENVLAGKGAWDRYSETVGRLRSTTPRPRVAVIFPRTSIMIGDSQAFDRSIHEMRKRFAFDLIDENNLRSITSSEYPLIVAPWGDVWTSQAVTEIERLAREGAAVIVHCEEPLRTLQGEVEFNERLFPVKMIQRADGWAYEPRRDQTKPFDESAGRALTDRRSLKIGTGSDEPFLSGKWGLPQDEKSASQFGFKFDSFRWLGERGKIVMPMIPRKDYRLEIEGFLPKGKTFQVHLNRRPFGVIEGSGEFKWSKPIAGNWRPRKPNVEIQLRGQTWNPGEVLGATQAFRAGMAVSRVAVLPLREPGDGESGDAGTRRSPEFKRKALRGSWLKEVGQGVTLLAPADFVNDWEFRQMLNAAVSEPIILDPKFRFSLPVVDGDNEIYVSPQRGSTLYLNLEDTRKQFTWGSAPPAR